MMDGSTLLLSDSVGTRDSFVSCRHVLVAVFKEPAQHSFLGTMRGKVGTKEAKEKGFVWQVNAASVPCWQRKGVP